MASIKVLALWSVVSQLPIDDLEEYARWLWKAQQGAIDANAGHLKPLMLSALKMQAPELAELSDLLVATVEVRYRDLDS